MDYCIITISCHITTMYGLIIIIILDLCSSIAIYMLPRNKILMYYCLVENHSILLASCGVYNYGKGSLLYTYAGILNVDYA